MLHTQISRIWLIAGLGVAVAGLSACSGSRSSAPELRFAVVAPLAEGYGARALRGAELAARRLNAEGGIGGRRVVLGAVDDGANTQRAVAIADSLYREGSVLAVIGHINSSTMLAAATIYNRGLVAVSPTATSPEVSEAGDWVFRVAPSDAANSAALARFALKQTGKRAAILYANDPYGRGLREGFSRAFTSGGGELVEVYPYLEGQTQDFEPYLQGLRASAPDLIFIAGLETGGGRIIQQVRDLGLRMPILGGDGLVGLAGQASVYDGTYIGLLYHPEAPGMVGRQFVDVYAAEYGESPDHFAALAYDAVMLVAQAVRESAADRQAIRSYLAGVGGDRGSFLGVSGSIAFDRHGDPVNKLYAVGRIAGNSIQLVEVEGGS